MGYLRSRWCRRPFFRLRGLTHRSIWCKSDKKINIAKWRRRRVLGGIADGYECAMAVVRLALSRCLCAAQGYQQARRIKMLQDLTRKDTT
jgi:hypothetical protein